MKEDPDMINRLLSMLPAVVFALIAHAVQAQSPSQPQPQSKPQPSAKPQPEVQAGVLYKSTMPDGKVRYSDAPIPGAVKVEKSKPDTSKRGITTATPTEMAAAAKRLEAQSAGAAASEVTRAPGARNANEYSTADLQEMLRKLETGREKFKEPVEGERIGTVGYLERQKRYDQSVEAVRREIEKRAVR